MANTVEAWSIDDVQTWMDTSEELKPHKAIFKGKEIDGAVLLTLTQGDLEGWGIIFGPARKVITKIELLKVQHNANPLEPEFQLPVQSSSTPVPIPVQLQPSFEELRGLLPHVFDLKIPVVQVYQPEHPEYINPGLLCSLNDHKKANFLLLEGHLGDPDKYSVEVGQIVDIFAHDQSSDGKPHAIRIRGPSGSGKTKVIYDVLRDTWGIYIDWSQTEPQDINNCRARIRSYVNNYKDQAEREEWCSYELIMLFAGRITALYLLLQTQKIAIPFSWLLLQINGLVSVNYSRILLPIRNFLRRTFNASHSLLSYFQAMASFIMGDYPIRVPAPFTIAHDEVNTLTRTLPDAFLSMNKKTRRPLIAFVLRTTYELSGIEVLVSGTNRIQDHYDYFASMTGSKPEELPRHLLDINMKPLSTPDIKTLQNKLFRNLPSSVSARIQEDGKRPRILTSFCGVLADNLFENVPIPVEGPAAKYEAYRRMLVHGLPLDDQEMDKVTFHHLVKEFVTNAGPEGLIDIMLQDTLSPDGFTLAESVIDYFDSNLLFVAKADDSEDGKYYLAEGVVVDAIRSYFSLNNIDLATKYAELIVNDSTGASSDGIRVEILICLYLTMKAVKLRLPNNLKFSVAATSADYKWSGSFKDWLSTFNTVLRCHPSLGVDVVFPLELQAGNLSDIFKNAPHNQWAIAGLVAAKTVQRQGRSVDTRDVLQGLKTTRFQCMYTTNDCSERKEFSVQKIEAFEELFEMSKSKNILFIRYQVCLPYPSHNALQPSESNGLPSEGTAQGRKVTITFNNLAGHRVVVPFFELTVAVDISNIVRFGLLSKAIVATISSKFPQSSQSAFPTTIELVPDENWEYEPPAVPEVQESSGVKRKRE